MADGPPPTTRRRLLAGLGATASAAVAGCSERLWSRAETSPPERVSLSIKTVPTDEDVVAAKISNQLIENLRAAGIEANPEPMAEDELYREVLVDHEYDLFVARHPGFDEFDALRPLLHSKFVSERGWQNPFSFSNPTVDEHLEEQLTERGYDRLAAFSDLFEHLQDTAPYTAVTFPDHLCAANGLDTLSTAPRRPLEYIELLSTPPADEDRDEPLRVGVSGDGAFDRLNPIVVTRNDVRIALGLLYDPLARIVDGDLVPWLAETVDWSRRESSLRATMTLREDARWHDGEPIDADDVAFTVRFLADTSLGNHEGGVPAPRFRGRGTLIDEVTVEDPRTVRYRFETTSPTVARRALTIPLLPRHVWEPESELVADYRTAALARANENPVGSGLFAFESRTDDGIALEPFDDHALLDGRSELLAEFPAYDGLEFVVEPSAGTAVESLENGDLDLVGSPLPPGEFERLGDDVTPLSAPTRTFYVIGYNLRHPELSNHRFRRIVSRLVDREYVAEEFSLGHARPAATHSAVVGVEPDTWEFPQSAGVATFPGSDGRVDVDLVRSLFEEAGYRYDDDGSLLV
ncbi:ABC transporter substrate-binding protein [Salinilacihabitans rarus]|uniref:ABC transporter substrate-binding protein n=1 Tax=Salinilacihabitans rarus TaxID=2961596 RepID=UPI0020C8844A|nr:ABC transporter substrate-binding protein [Salinilacihabitans rarus]